MEVGAGDKRGVAGHLLLRLSELRVTRVWGAERWAEAHSGTQCQARDSIPQCSRSRRAQRHPSPAWRALFPLGGDALLCGAAAGVL